MKILPLLTGTLLQEAFAQDPTACADDAAIVEVTCHDDLMVQLQVNKYCLKERYPGVKVTELKIGQTGVGSPPIFTTCVACTDAQPQSRTPTDPDYCNPEEKFFAYDILYNPESSAPGYGPVISSDPPPAFQNLWFKVGNCGSSMTIKDDKAVFETTLYKPPTVDPITQIVSQKTVLPADIICKYPLTIQGLNMDPGADIVVDDNSPGKVVDPNADVQDIGTNVFDLTVFDESNGKVIKPGDKVSVGDAMKISVSAKDAAITEYFLVMCTATNKKPSEAPDKSLELIKAGCMVDLGLPLQPEIDAKSPNPGDYISFNQFGFMNPSAETKLTFVLTCNIKLGIAPTDADCSPLKAGRKRRQTTDEEIEFTQTTEYTIELNDTMALDTYGDIVVAHVGEEKLDDKSGNDGQTGQEGGKSDAITNTVALMAGTAIMLL